MNELSFRAEAENKHVPVEDKKVRFRFPRDGYDLKYSSSQNRIATGLEVEAGIREKIISSGVSEVSLKSPTFVELATEDASELSVFGEETASPVGLAIMPTEGERSGMIFFNVLPYIERDGQKYRILSFRNSPLKKSAEGMPHEELVRRINKVFIPSEGISTGSGEYLLMPIIDRMEHVTTITQDQLNDFLARLEESGIDVSIDISEVSPDQAINTEMSEINLAIYGGRIYISDAGDVLSGKFVQPGQSQNIAHIKELLRNRVK